MCPVCIATAALIAGSASGTGGVMALVVAKFRKARSSGKFPKPPNAEEVHDDNNHDGIEAP
jgi:hypothetical protein